ncbi:hypothetical protein GCM10027053_00910 [Intrasporangium mesophilum]
MDNDETRYGKRIQAALERARMSQRELQNATGISQATVSRIVQGQRAATLPELIAISRATGAPMGRLTGASTVAERTRCAARGDSGAAMTEMHERLLGYLELADYLDEQAIGQ